MLGNAQPVSEDERTSKNGEGTSLVEGSQGQGNHVDQRRDAEGDLHEGKVKEAVNALLSISGDGCCYLAAAGVQE